MTVTITHERSLYTPPLVSAAWQTGAGEPGSLTFTAYGEDLPMAEGDEVVASAGDGGPFFRGYVFTRRRDGRGFVTVTAYDQLRYLKNRGTYVYGGITAGDLLCLVAGDHGLTLNIVSPTGVVLEPCAEDNKTLADILRNALEKTEEAGGKRFVLFDDGYGLSLRDKADLYLDLVLSNDCMQSFSRTDSIDSGVYNTVKLLRDTKRGREEFVAADPAHVKRWGKLQLVQRITGDVAGQAQAAELLKLYNAPAVEITVGGVPGDVRVRAGCSLYIERSLYNVDHARHVWKNGGYFMDLRLSE